eukprot:TRINITY_DN4475_c0_g1_i1.p1 TRINITY_DN4475_c0_g1~~TRINITY_DN4475_c0_g1_i1.p1  ORF type:complete len:172 (-),score=43.31 TRINITY_DN4475_c0_g1_i1:316-831(-)
MEDSFVYDGVIKTGYHVRVEVKEIKNKGRGVFTLEPIKKSQIIELAPVIVIPKNEYKNHVTHSIFSEYVFKWDRGDFALALGFGSMFNHDNTPNVGWIRLPFDKCIRYSALRDIEDGEELTISYGKDLWFDDKNSNNNNNIEKEEEEEILDEENDFFQNFNLSPEITKRNK